MLISFYVRILFEIVKLYHEIQYYYIDCKLIGAILLLKELHCHTHIYELLQHGHSHSDNINYEHEERENIIMSGVPIIIHRE